jgi:dTDP-4-amino-4,6-dideoxy-D-galactose acyltransferase
MSTTPPCEILAWDSEHFGCRVGRVRGNRLDRERLAAIEGWLAAEAIDCLYFLADSGDPATAMLAEEAGFRLVDLRVTLTSPPWPPSPIAPPAPGRGGNPLEAASRIRPARPEDVPALRRLAAASHHDSRFYADPHFDRGRCDELYATWIEKSCREDAVLVAEAEGNPAGYISCRVSFPPLPVEGGAMGEGGQGGEGLGEIGLLAVDAAAQGRGLGSALVGAALCWFAARRAARVQVVTQGRNTRAQRLYQAHGLLTHSIGLWFHRWPDRHRRHQETFRETERE